MTYPNSEIRNTLNMVFQFRFAISNISFPNIMAVTCHMGHLELTQNLYCDPSPQIFISRKLQ